MYVHTHTHITFSVSIHWQTLTGVTLEFSLCSKVWGSGALCAPGGAPTINGAAHAGAQNSPSVPAHRSYGTPVHLERHPPVCPRLSPHNLPTCPYLLLLLLTPSVPETLAILLLPGPFFPRYSHGSLLLSFNILMI